MTVLYHYCSNNAFHSIISSRSIWLSSLTLSNDSMEGKLVAALLNEIAENDGLDSNTINRLQQSTNMLERMFDGLGFCLSEEGDLLSQWRGYGSDAAGVSIGFSKTYLESLANSSRNNEKSGFALQKVEYERDAQIKLIKPTYLKIKEFIDKGAFKPLGPRSLLDTRSEEEIEKDNEEIKKAYKSLSLVALILFKDLFLLKNRAFKEEKEWRLLSHLIKVAEDDCEYRALNDRIIPYRVFELSSLGEAEIIEVVVGPKNRTPPKVIESFLKKYGFENANVFQSEATYQ